MHCCILKGRSQANCVWMLLAKTPIHWDQDSYHYKEDLSGSQENDHFKNSVSRTKKKGQFNFTSVNYENELNSKQAT